MGTVNVVLSLLAVLTSLGCMVLLYRAYAQSGLRLLLWSALCFVFLTGNNVFLFLDFVISDIDFRPMRLGAALMGLLFLLYGFIWEAE
jgi:hypothetical protein